MIYSEPFWIECQKGPGEEKGGLEGFRHSAEERIRVCGDDEGALSDVPSFDWLG